MGTKSERPRKETLDAAPRRIVGYDGLGEYLNNEFTRRWLERRVHERGIPFLKCGKFVVFDLDAIDRWLDEQSVEPEA